MKHLRFLVFAPLMALAAGCSESSNPVAASSTGAAAQGAIESASIAPLGAQASKVDVCHVNGTGGFQLITVSANAWPAHQAHGDGQPLGAVPGGGGTVFDAACVKKVVPVPTYIVGGTVSGMAASGLVLRNNGGNDLSIGGNGGFTFSTALATGQSYAVTVFTQPSGQTCSVTSGSGSVAGANVTSVVVTCMTNTYTIGGSVSGLTATGLVLRNNGGNDLALGGNGSFTFSTPIATGQGYAVTVFTQPSGQRCQVTAGSGVVAAANITGVSVACMSLGRKRAFVSSSSFSANFGGHLGADAACQNLAARASLGGTWMAWVSTSLSSPAARFTHASVPYCRIDGTLIAADWVALTSGALANGVATDENGTLVLNAEVWTATSSSGTYAGGSCNDFTDTSNGAPYSSIGISDRSGHDWTSAFLQFCDRTGLRLYCFEQ